MEKTIFCVRATKHLSCHSELPFDFAQGPVNTWSLSEVEMTLRQAQYPVEVRRVRMMRRVNIKLLILYKHF